MTNILNTCILHGHTRLAYSCSIKLLVKIASCTPLQIQWIHSANFNLILENEAKHLFGILRENKKYFTKFDSHTVNTSLSSYFWPYNSAAIHAKKRDVNADVPSKLVFFQGIRNAKKSLIIRQKVYWSVLWNNEEIFHDCFLKNNIWIVDRPHLVNQLQL